MTGHTISFSEARTLATALLQSAGMPEEPARRSAALLVQADLWGVSSHGLLRLPYYLDRLGAGGLNPTANLATVRDAGAVVAFDGNHGIGHWQLWHAASVAAQRATHYGVAIASVGSSSHCGALGLYTLPGIRRELISLVFSTGPAVIAPPDTPTPVLSTSPLAAGIPCRPRPAIVDLATSAVARGKIAAYGKRGEPLPQGWAVDATGEPTTDPAVALAGMLAPLGGAKGFALAFMVEALAAAAVGPELATDVPDMFNPDSNTSPQRIGHLVITFDPRQVDVDGSSQARADKLAARVVEAGGRVPGASRQMPWEIGDDTPVQVATEILEELRSRTKGTGAR